MNITIIESSTKDLKNTDYVTITVVAVVSRPGDIMTFGNIKKYKHMQDIHKKDIDNIEYFRKSLLLSLFNEIFEIEGTGIIGDINIY